MTTRTLSASCEGWRMHSKVTHRLPVGRPARRVWYPLHGAWGQHAA
jgi:hypothetical protein